MNQLNLIPPDDGLSISEIADFLGLHKSSIFQLAARHNWQETGERVQGGGDKYNIETIRFYKSDEKSEAARQKIKDKIKDEKDFAREELDAAMVANHISKIKEEMRQDRLNGVASDAPLTLDEKELLWLPLAQKGNEQQEKAFDRVKAVHEYWDCRRAIGMTERDAAEQAAKKYGVTPGSVRNWVRDTNDYHPSDWVAVLINKCDGKSRPPAEFTPEAWTAFKTDYLRRGKGKQPPTIASCYRRLEAAARVNGWVIPIQRTVINWIKNKMDPMVVMYRREGMEAVERCYPCQKRNKEMFEVLEAINGDGFMLSIYADFGNGIIAQPIVWSWQDIRTSKVTAWRMDVSENAELIRLTLLDHITEHSIPTYVYIDNTTAAASKQITGGLPNRYRWKVKDTDPLGIIPLIGSQYKPTLPGHGQSKPVERLQGKGGYVDFGNLPIFEGRGSKARPIPIAEVEILFNEFVNEINARPDRRGDSVQGKSFDQVFSELLPETIITKATEKQRKYCMCVAEVVTANRTDGSVTLRAGKSDIGSNRYWDAAMSAYMGQKVTVRFDPANMHSGVYVETLKGEEICFAEPTATGGFKDSTAAREHARNKGHFKKHVRLAAEAEGRMNADTARQYMVSTPEPEKPQPKATRIAANVPSRGKAVAVAVVDQEKTAVILPIKSGLELFAQAKKAEVAETGFNAAEAWERGAAALVLNKKAM